MASSSLGTTIERFNYLFRTELGLKGNYFTGFNSILTVPSNIPAKSTSQRLSYFIWPGLQAGTGSNKLLDGTFCTLQEY
jgi:hypothetical protein